MNQQLFPGEPFPLPEAVDDPRKAALLLHAMSQEDQRWILSQLPEDQSQLLATLLLELKDVGMPSDPALLEEVIASEPDLKSSRRGEIASTITASNHIAALEKTDPGVLAQLLNEEPAGLIARFLQLHDWPWAESFLAQLRAVKRHQVEEQLSLLDGLAIGDVLSAQMLQGLYLRLGQDRVLDDTLNSTVANRTKADQASWWIRLRRFRLFRRRTGVDG